MPHKKRIFAQLNERSHKIFCSIVESYLENGEPIGSRNLSKALPIKLSPASIRNVMADLEERGFVYAPHVSAGRLPTQKGLRFFVDACLELRQLSKKEQDEIDSTIGNLDARPNYETILSETSDLLSGLSCCAGVVLESKGDKKLQQVEFIRLEDTKALVVLVSTDREVENRIINIPLDIPNSSLIEASNYLSTHLRGRTITETKAFIEREQKVEKAQLDSLTRTLVEAGIASWQENASGNNRTLIVRGQAKLLNNLNASEDIERVRQLFIDLERKSEVMELFSLAEKGNGVRIFIGSENKLFSLSGSSLVLSPYYDSEKKVIGVLGVIGPTRLNYARIVPVVDYTAKLVTHLLT
ncbi:MAG: heat-inducible transcriptional repressor HrcA [Alphaproteobacteria bacterium]|nr:heat-inducible transcriptional repressor HrcA [Alphaproteobacteria bacterium]